MNECYVNKWISFIKNNFPFYEEIMTIERQGCFDSSDNCLHSQNMNKMNQTCQKIKFQSKKLYLSENSCTKILSENGQR